MKKILRHLYRPGLKEDARKLEINLITASIVGGLITHLTDMTPVGVLLLGWVGIAGVAATLFGLYKGGPN